MNKDQLKKKTDLENFSISCFIKDLEDKLCLSFDDRALNTKGIKKQRQFKENKTEKNFKKFIYWI